MIYLVSSVNNLQKIIYLVSSINNLYKIIYLVSSVNNLYQIIYLVSSVNNLFKIIDLVSSVELLEKCDTDCCSYITGSRQTQYSEKKNIIYLVSSVNNFYKIIYLLCELLETRYSVALTPLAAERFNMADKKIIFLSLPLSYLIFAEDPV